MSEKSSSMSFWEHLDQLRSVLIRCFLAWGIGTIITFGLKDWLFAVVFAPARSDFVLYRVLCRLADKTHISSLCMSDFNAQFINTELTAQFTTHLEVALWTGLIITFPYIIYKLYGFVAPALYEQERKYSIRFILSGTLLFLCGVLLNYFIIFPFSFRFLAGYQVQAEVVNQIALQSYVSSLVILSVLMGLLFELPLAGYFLAKAGILNAEMLSKYRKHAFVVIMIVAALITPTADVFTLMLVTIPIYLLYELTIKIVKRTAVNS